jgi:hypothetical protein
MLTMVLRCLRRLQEPTFRPALPTRLDRAVTAAYRSGRDDERDAILGAIEQYFSGKPLTAEGVDIMTDVMRVVVLRGLSAELRKDLA